MRHRKRGRVLGRSPSHRRALLRNLASALFLTEVEAATEADADVNIGHVKNPRVVPVAKVRGRIVTTLPKAKEVRPLVEKCITIARAGLKAEEAAAPFATRAVRRSTEWKAWREGPQWRQWAAAMAPAVKARRRVIELIRDKHAMRVLFEKIAPRFADRPGGYTRILKLAKPRLGDAGARAILEFVGKNDRVTERAQAPKFDEPSAAAK